MICSGRSSASCHATTATGTPTVHPGHGADHVLPAIVSPSVTLPVLDGRVAFGTWQSLVLVDLNGDNPRRHVRFSFLPAPPG